MTLCVLHIIFSMEREIWKEVFQKIGISSDELTTMSSMRFREVRKFAIESGLFPDNCKFIDDDVVEVNKQYNNQRSSYPPPVRRCSDEHSQFHFDFKDISKNPSALIRDDQNVEYIQALSEAQEQERIDNEIKELAKYHKAQEQKIKEQKLKEQKMTRDMILQMAKEIGPEPSEGIAIAVNLLGGKRVSRKFSSDTKGGDVYAWVAGFDEMFVKSLFPIKFSLKDPFGTDLIKETTLMEQKIAKRVLFNALEEEE